LQKQAHTPACERVSANTRIRIFIESASAACVYCSEHRQSRNSRGAIRQRAGATDAELLDFDVPPGQRAANDRPAGWIHLFVR